jgi:uncharacterized protein (DUF3084 family)
MTHEAAERARIADERDDIADERDEIADERELAWIRWEAKCHEVTGAADRRDLRADTRDIDADRRDAIADRDEYLVGSEGIQPPAARALARMDRGYAKSNRIASSVDRFQLTFFTPGAAERRAAAKRRIAAAARLEAEALRRDRLRRTADKQQAGESTT